MLVISSLRSQALDNIKKIVKTSTLGNKAFGAMSDTVIRAESLETLAASSVRLVKATGKTHAKQVLGSLSKDFEPNVAATLFKTTTRKITAAVKATSVDGALFADQYRIGSDSRGKMHLVHPLDADLYVKFFEENTYQVF